jgi:hypothetical protein
VPSREHAPAGGHGEQVIRERQGMKNLRAFLSGSLLAGGAAPVNSSLGTRCKECNECIPITSACLAVEVSAPRRRPIAADAVETIL